MNKVDLGKWVTGHICSYCGGELDVRMIGEDNWPCCGACSKIEWGAKPPVYELAKKYVDEWGFEFYTYRVVDDDDLRKLSNISKLCDIINWLAANDEGHYVFG